MGANLKFPVGPRIVQTSPCKGMTGWAEEALRHAQDRPFESLRANGGVARGDTDGGWRRHGGVGIDLGQGAA